MLATIEPKFSANTHNGKITVLNPATGVHRTFEIVTKKKTARFAPGKRVLSLLTGPNNEDDFTGFAFINDDGTVYVWKRYIGTQYERYARLIQNLAAETERWNLEVRWAAKCRCCNKELTDPVSLEIGMGPICREKH